MEKEVRFNLNDELSSRLDKVAKKVGLSPDETAKMLLVERLSGERPIDWPTVISKARDFIARII